MASTIEHKPTGLFLSFCRDWREGTVVTLSIYSQSKFQTYADGKPAWCEFTQYTLSAPVAHLEDGTPLFHLPSCNPVCAIDVPRLSKAEA